MNFTLSRKSRWALALLACVSALAVPPMARAVTPQPVDMGSAYPLSSSPVTATVDAVNAPDAVFSLALNAGDRVTASTSATSGVNVGVRIFSPYGTLADVPLAQKLDGAYPRTAAYSVPYSGPAGRYYLDMRAASGVGEPQLVWSIKRGTRASISTNHSVVAYKGSAKLTIGLKDSTGQIQRYQYVKVYTSYNGSTWSYSKSVKTGSTGYTTLSVSPTRKTYYRVAFAGNGTLMASPYSASVSVAPKVSLGRPVAPSRMICNKSYTIYGSLKPRQRSGSHLVYLKAYHYEDGGWELKKSALTTNRNHSSYSRYKKSLALNTPGKWLIKAYAPAGSTYAATWSSGKRVTVPKQKAKKVKAWVDESSPDPYTYVTAYAKVKDPYGKVIKGAKVKFTWHYKTSTPSEIHYTDSSGIATCTRYISGATSGYYVRIDVKASSGGTSARTSTGFTPN